MLVLNPSLHLSIYDCTQQIEVNKYICTKIRIIFDIISPNFSFLIGFLIKNTQKKMRRHIADASLSFFVIPLILFSFVISLRFLMLIPLLQFLLLRSKLLLQDLLHLLLLHYLRTLPMLLLHLQLNKLQHF